MARLHNICGPNKRSHKKLDSSCYTNIELPHLSHTPNKGYIGGGHDGARRRARRPLQGAAAERPAQRDVLVRLVQPAARDALAGRGAGGEPPMPRAAACTAPSSSGRRRSRWPSRGGSWRATTCGAAPTAWRRARWSSRRARCCEDAAVARWRLRLALCAMPFGAALSQRDCQLRWHPATAHRRVSRS